MHATLAFSAVPLFLGALLSNWAYAQTYEVQWTNFADWLTAGGLVFAGLALLWGLVDMVRWRGTPARRGWIELLLLLGAIVLGFINALVLAKDGWAAMPAALVLSALVLLLMTAASFMGLSAQPRRTA
jgi:uncharacterized membrane protein